MLRGSCLVDAKENRGVVLKKLGFVGESRSGPCEDVRRELVRKSGQRHVVERVEEPIAVASAWKE
jgi:hypothetical protein